MRTLRSSVGLDLSQTKRGRRILPAIGHEGYAKEAEDHHRPGGRFGDAADPVLASGKDVVKFKRVSRRRQFYVVETQTRKRNIGVGSKEKLVAV